MFLICGYFASWDVNQGRWSRATYYLTILSLRNEVDVPSSRTWTGSVTTLSHRMLGPGVRETICFHDFSLRTLILGTRLSCCVEAPPPVRRHMWREAKVPGFQGHPNSQMRDRADSPATGMNCYWTGSSSPGRAFSPGEADPISPHPSRRFTCLINGCCLKRWRLRMVCCAAINNQTT